MKLRPLVSFALAALACSGFAFADTVNLTSTAVSDDAYVVEGAPSSNFGSDEELYLGDANSSNRYRTLIRFNIPSSLNGATIHSAKLTVSGGVPAGSGDPLTQVLRNTESWSQDSVTWGSLPSTTTADNNTIRLTNEGTTVVNHTWDVTKFVQAWVDGTPNYGVTLKPISSVSTVFVLLASEADSTAHEPRLSIDYTPVAPNVEYTLYRVSDTSGSSNSTNPGSAKSSFNVGDTVRLTFKANNSAAVTPVYAMANVRTGVGETTVYRSPESGITPIGGGIGNSTESPLYETETDYYSFDISTVGWQTGSYDISGKIKESVSGTVLDTTADGRASEDYDSWWKTSRFSLQQPPNPAPTVTGFSAIMRMDGRIDFNYTATDADGIGYVGVYLVNSDGSVNSNFTTASEVQYSSGLESGQAQSVPPWNAAQLAGWLTTGTGYKLRMKAQDNLGNDTGWLYSNTFTFGVPDTPLPAPNVSVTDAEVEATTTTVRWTWGGNLDQVDRLELSLRRLSDNAVLVPATEIPEDSTSFLIASLVPAMEYRVNIAYIGEEGYINASDSHEWTTRLASPQLTGPSDGSENVTVPVSFTWNPIPSASAYRLQVSDSLTGFSAETGFPNPLLDQGVAGTESQFDWSAADPDETLYATLRVARPDFPTSRYATPWSFTTESIPTIIIHDAWTAIHDVVAGQQVQWTYRIESSADASLLLGASLLLPDQTRSIALLRSSETIQVQAGTHNYSLSGTIPCIDPDTETEIAGTYHIRAGVWRDRNGNQQIDGDPPDQILALQNFTNPSATMQISPANPPALAVVADQSRVTEGSQATFTFSRSETTACPVTIRYRIDTAAANSATHGTDYWLIGPDATLLPVQGTLELATGEVQTQITVALETDTVDDPDEIIRLEIVPDAAYSIVPAKAAAEVSIISANKLSGQLTADLSAHDGKQVGGQIYFAGTVAAPSGHVVRSVSIVDVASGIPLAFTPLDGTDSLPNLADLHWRDFLGRPAFEWSDILGSSVPVQLKLRALMSDHSGAPGSTAPQVIQDSAPFTVTLQDSFTASIESATDFPVFVRDTETVLSASEVGASGAVSYRWFGRGGTELGSSSQVSATADVYGVNLFTLEATSGNQVYFARFLAPVARTLTSGPAAADSSRSFGVRGVNLSTGNHHLAFTDLQVPAIGVPFVLRRYYNSDPKQQLGIWSDNGSGTVTVRTRHWTWSYLDARITFDGILNSLVGGENGRTVTVDIGDGARQEFFLGLDGTYHTNTPGNFAQLFEDYSQQKFFFIERNGFIYEFGFPEVLGAAEEKGYFTARKLLSVKDRRGQGLTLHYINGGTRLSHIIDATGRQYDFHYNGDQLQGVSDFSGRAVGYAWEGNEGVVTDLLGSVLDVRGKTTRFFYRTQGAGAGRLKTITQPEGNQVLQSMTYDSERRVSSLTDGRGNRTTFDYQADHTTALMPDERQNMRVRFDPLTREITAITRSLGTPEEHTVESEFEDVRDYSSIAHTGLAEGSSREISNHQGQKILQKVDLSYDANGDLSSWKDPLGHVSESNVIHIPETNLSVPDYQIDRRGERWDYQFDPTRGDLLRSESPEGNTSTFTYYENGLMKTAADGESNLTQYFYDEHGYLDHIVDAGNFTTDYEVDDLGRITKVTDPEGVSVSRTYDPAGNIKSETLDQLTIGSGESRSLLMDYDDNGRLVSRTDRRGQVTTYTWNEVNLPETVTVPTSAAAPGNRVLSFAYDEMNRLETSTNLNQHTSTRFYDARGRVQRVENHLGETVASLTYYEDNTVHTRTDGEGITLTYEYDKNQRLERVRDPLGNATEFDYDEEGNLIRKRDPRGVYTLYEYDTDSRLVRIINVIGGQMDPDHPNNYRTVIGYDRNNQVTSVTDPLGSTTVFRYDALNRLDDYLDPLGRTWDYTYWDNGLLKQKTTPQGKVFTYQFDEVNRLHRINYPDALFAEFTYDANGNRTRLEGAEGATTYNYDSRNKMTSCSDPWGFTVGYDYYPGGNLKTLTYPGNKNVAYTWDGAERMKTVSPWAGGTWTYNYRANSQLDQVVNGNGTTVNYDYDAAGRLIDLIHRSGGGAQFARQQFTRLDALGNIEQENASFPLARPLPDARAMTVDDTNRLATVNGENATVDGDGRLGSLPGTSPMSFSFVGPDWLASATRGAVTDTFAYNAVGHRIAKTEGTSGQQTRYAHNPNGSLSSVVMEADGGNSPQRYYIYGLGLLAGIDAANDAVATYHFDHRGNTVALSDSSENLTDSYNYSPYGTRVAAGAGTPNPYQFAGQIGIQTDHDNLYHMRARYYLPQEGRFASLDPIGFGDGLNRYAYVGGNPLGEIDPNGTRSFASQLLAVGINNPVLGGIADYGFGIADPAINIYSNFGDIANSDIAIHNTAMGFMGTITGILGVSAKSRTADKAATAAYFTERMLELTMGTHAHWKERGWIDGSKHFFRELAVTSSAAICAKWTLSTGKSSIAAQTCGELGGLISDGADLFGASVGRNLAIIRYELLDDRPTNSPSDLKLNDARKIQSRTNQLVDQAGHSTMQEYGPMTPSRQPLYDQARKESYNSGKDGFNRAQTLFDPFGVTTFSP